MQRTLFNILSKLVLLLIISSIAALPLFAQNHQTITIKGRVINQQTRASLAGANIYEPESRIGTATNDKGYFQIEIPAAVSKLK
jgi:uncharacterized membrane protein